MLDHVKLRQRFNFKITLIIYKKVNSKLHLQLNCVSGFIKSIIITATRTTTLVRSHNQFQICGLVMYDLSLLKWLGFVCKKLQNFKREPQKVTCYYG